MSVKKTVKQIQKDAISAATNYRVNETSHDFRAGYVKGVRSLAHIIQLARYATMSMARESKDDPILHRILNGYADTLDILIDTAEDIIPPEYEMGE